MSNDVYGMLDTLGHIIICGRNLGEGSFLEFNTPFLEIDCAIDLWCQSKF